MDNPDSKPDKSSRQIRIGSQTVREIDIEATAEGVSMKALIERLWSNRKDAEFSFFPDVFGLE